MKFSNVFSIVLLLLQVVLASSVNAAGSIGKEFTFAFLENYNNKGNPIIYVSSVEGASGTVEIPGLGFSQSFAVEPNQVATIEVPKAAQYLKRNDVSDLGVHLVANADVSVYGVNMAQYTTDGFLALPSAALSQQYIVSSYFPLHDEAAVPSMAAVVATSNDTNIQIIPNVDLGENKAGIPIHVNLDRFQVYLLSSDEFDVTGTVIKSDKPIAVMGGNMCADVPNDPSIGWCDHLVEMSTPVDAWGKRFSIVPLATRRQGDIIRIIASEPGTQAVLNGEEIDLLSPTEVFETIITARTSITANKPILVTHYSASATLDHVLNSDPFMMHVTPDEQFIRE